MLPEDSEGVHFGAFLDAKTRGNDDSREPVAVLSLFCEDIPIDSGSKGQKCVRFRKFACHPDFQGQGIGSALLLYAFEYAKTQLKAYTAWCDARVSTATWYEKRGMTAFGETFLKGNVEYVRMRTCLVPESSQ
jgi:GNAT superfamily N-acetyltransferase